ncbi:DMT family transporter [Anoxybacteroides tepidamans]|uniref:DMT family transporter n=1 Tax=Anoxybacteroides tepidamans TaxID=265948 RepID=UPI0004816D54|nr:DMT family transporter [Anoxybacillus tepidamans]
MSQTKANVMLFVVTIFWGSSYLFMKMGLGSVQPFALIAWRFSIAFLLSAFIFRKRLLRIDIKTFKSAVILGTLLFLVFAFVTVGVQSTSTSHAGFLVSLTVIFVPLFSAVFFKKKPEKRVIVGVFLAMVGIGFLTLNHELVISYGDVMCMLTAVCYAFHIIATEQLTKNVDSLALGVLQLGVCGGLSLVCSLLLEAPAFPSDSASWIAILALSVLCSAIGFVVQTVAQKYTSAAHTGLIFSLEPVFAALFGYLFLGEMLSAKGYVGAALVLIGVIYAQLHTKKRRQKNISVKNAIEA